MADTHESCFLCKRSNPDRHVYYKDYEELEGQHDAISLTLDYGQQISLTTALTSLYIYATCIQASVCHVTHFCANRYLDAAVVL